MFSKGTLRNILFFITKFEPPQTAEQVVLLTRLIDLLETEMNKLDDPVEEVDEQDSTATV